MATSLSESAAREKFWNLYRDTFEQLYRYCARRASTKPVIAFIMKSLYEYALDEIRHGEEIILVDLFKWAYEFFAVQSQPKKGAEMMQQIKRIHDFRDVYNVKTDSGSRTFRREQILENFYNHLEFKEREVLWLSFFEELTEADRAYVMAMSEEECTKFFYESLKKAKQVVTMATSGQKGFGRLAAYFGGVSSLLKNAKQHEELDVDQEIYTSLRGIFMDQFSRNPQPVADTVPPTTSSVPPIRPVSSFEPVTTANATSASSARSADAFDDNDDWIEDEESFSSGLWRRLQGVLVLVIVAGFGFFAYTKFFSIDARVNRLLQDTRVVFSEEFKPEEKTAFVQEVLLALSKNRSFDSLDVRHSSKNFVEVKFTSKDSGIEDFVLYPEVQKFDAPKWQPKQYLKIKTVS